MKNARVAMLAGAFAALVASGADAQILRSGEPSFISLGVGVYDINDDFTAADFRAEFRWGKGFFDVVKPFVGVQGTSDGTIYGFFGLGVDLHLGDRIVVTPNVAAGLLDEGSGKDLGSPLRRTCVSAPETAATAKPAASAATRAFFIPPIPPGAAVNTI